MLTHLATPAEANALGELNDNQLVRQAYVLAGSGAVVQAEVLKRFAQLKRDYQELSMAHEGCGPLAEKLAQVEKERDSKAAEFNKLMVEFKQLEDEVSSASARQEGLEEQLEDLGREKNEWMSTASSQAAQIRELEKQLSCKTSEIQKLGERNKQLTAEVAQSEHIRHNTVKELLPAVCRRLFQSHEYKRSMGRVYSLSYQAGFIDGVKAEFKDGVKVDRDPEEVRNIFQQVKRINLDAPNIWKGEYAKIFDAEYPFIKKVTESYHLPLGDLMNFQPAPPPSRATPVQEGSAPKPQDKAGDA